MADTHISLNDEVEVTIKVKVKFTQVSYYGERTGDQIHYELESAKEEIAEHLLQKIEGEAQMVERLGHCKWGYMNYSFDVEPIK